MTTDQPPPSSSPEKPRAEPSATTEQPEDTPESSAEAEPRAEPSPPETETAAATSTPPPASVPGSSTFRDRLAQRWRHSEGGRRRLALSAAVGSVGALVLGVVDALWARSSSDAAPGLGTVLTAAVGLLTPLTLLLGLLVGAGSWFLHPRAAPTVSRFFEWLRATGTGRPADIAAFVPLAATATFLWATFSAQLARQVLALEISPRLCGLAVATGAGGIALVLAFGVLALTPVLRRYLATWRTRFAPAVDPAFTLLVGLSICVALLIYGTWTGGVSGEGGLFGIYGVLKRQELDLRMPAMLGGLALAIYLAPPRLGWLRRSYQAWLIALVPLTLTAHAAGSLNDHGDVAQLLERGAPLAKRSLAAMRRLTDRDGDGASGWFAGGDCHDGDPAINPLADEIPDNGVDEDCSGADLSLAALEASEPPAPVAPPGMLDRVPKNGNIVVIGIDALRWDVGYMGYERAVTPNIDALAKRSTVFERAYAMASYTGKAIGPMLIGKHCSETHRNWGHFNKFGEEDTFIAERLQRAGIRTLSVQGHRYFGKFGGIERGFDVVDLSAAPDEKAKWATDTTVTSVKMTDAAIGLLQAPEQADKRFFLWMHYLDPHADYLQHDDAPDFGSDTRDLYDNEVAFTDKHVGRLLDFIAQAPWADRTTIIITSDHGEAFGEHKMFRHGFELWEELVRIPLVIHMPGAEPSRVKVKRSQVDLVPTILQLMDIDLPPHTSKADKGASEFISGLSLLPDILAPPDEPPADRDVLVDMPGGPYNGARRAFIHGDLKLVISRGAHKELYDLAADPKERKNLWHTDRERRKSIEERYALAKARLREIKVTGKSKQ